VIWKPRIILTREIPVRTTQRCIVASFQSNALELNREKLLPRWKRVLGTESDFIRSNLTRGTASFLRAARTPESVTERTRAAQGVTVAENSRTRGRRERHTLDKEEAKTRKEIVSSETRGSRPKPANDTRIKTLRKIDLHRHRSGRSETSARRYRRQPFGFHPPQNINIRVRSPILPSPTARNTLNIVLCFR